MSWLRRLMARIYDGSIVIGGRAWNWTWSTPEGGIALGRKVWAAFLVFAGYQVMTHLPGLMWVVVAVWLWAAFRAAAAQLDAGEKPEEIGAEELLDDEPDEGDDFNETDIAVFVQLLRELIGNGPGAHLVEIAQAVTGNPRDTALVRELCAAADVPVAAGTRSAGRPGVSTGVRRVDLPPAPPAASGAPESGPVAVVGPGQDEQQGQQQQQQQPVGRIVPDPDGGPNKWRVEW